MKIKYLSLSLILLTGCSTTPAPEQTPVIEETAEDPTTSWMTPTQKEKNEIDPFPEYAEIEGWHPQKNKRGEPDLRFPSIDPVFRDNIADSFAIHLKNYLDDPYAYWYHIYKKDDHVYETEDTTQWFPSDPHYQVIVSPQKDPFFDGIIDVHQYTDEEDGLLTLRIEMPEYELMSPFYQDIFDPFLPKECKTEDMQNYFFHIDDHYEDKDLEFEEEFPEIYGTKKFIIDHSGDSEEGCKYILEYKTKSSYIYDKIQDSDYEVH